ncbi:nicotinate-nucleotide--dimethylbenzimidazole phosphoribosyltransferase [Butyrivibrio hungatei]|uniref:nicotinate-nucleotide--dimethylbenzimidazole phosphoribosyltransferase n=1 Tax=Butyrivibrio hungatei TaxID=185008 RepID=UPI000A532E6B|nr:nicotinate-nucleotide--dimethylbenzimidazole phosphoribosyltransferase [Butyrivibrio hungatei]
MNKEMLKTLENCIGKVEKVDDAAVKAASDYNDSLVKPPRSMGELENIAIKLAGITGHAKNKVGKKTIYVFCADNGVVEEGVASSPVSVTAMQALNMTRGLTGVAVLARHTGY